MFQTDAKNTNFNHEDKSSSKITCNYIYDNIIDKFEFKKDLDKILIKDIYTPFNKQLEEYKKRMEAINKVFLLSLFHLNNTFPK